MWVKVLLFHTYFSIISLLCIFDILIIYQRECLVWSYLFEMLNISCVWMYTSFFRFGKFSATLLVNCLYSFWFYLCSIFGKNLQVLPLEYIPNFLDICYCSLSFSTYMFVSLSPLCHTVMLIGLILYKSCASSHSCFEYIRTTSLSSPENVTPWPLALTLFLSHFVQCSLTPGNREWYRC